MILFTVVRTNYTNQMERKDVTVFQYCDSKREWKQINVIKRNDVEQV